MSQYGGMADRHTQAGQQPFSRAPSDGMTEQPYDAGHAHDASCPPGYEMRSTLSESATSTLIRHRVTRAWIKTPSHVPASPEEIG
jgi:hypothetical protein